MHRIWRIVVVALAALFALPAAAETYPSHPIKLYLAFPPGGAADIVARLLAQPLSEKLGQPVVVENKPGSGGNIVGDLVAHAKPDGYSLLLGPDNVFTINPHLYRKMSFDPMKDLVPVSSVVINELLLVVGPKVPAKTFKDFIALAKSSNPPLFYASIGNGSQHHLAMEMLKQAAGINLTHVPYRGGGPAALAVIAGNVSAMFGGGSVFRMVEQKQLRGLAVSGRDRIKQMPDLPSISEFYPDYDATIWQALFAPAGTPQPIIDKIDKAVKEIQKTKEFIDKLEKTGAGEPYVTTTPDFLARIKRDSAKYAAIIKSTGIEVR